MLAPRLAPALISVAICLHLPSLGLAVTPPPALPPARPLPPLCLSLLTALVWQVLDHVEGRQVTQWLGRAIRKLRALLGGLDWRPPG